MNDTVRLEIADSIATVTLNRPAALNALNADMKDALLETVSRVEADPAVRCMVIRGAGESFMAGGDLKSFAEDFGRDALWRRRRFLEGINNMHPLLFAMRRMPKPVIASVHGYAAGFGVSLAVACDLTICADDAKFTLAYVRIGTSPDGGASYFLPRLVGLKKAMEIALLGDEFSAEEARDLGMVNMVVPRGALAERTDALARRLAAGPTQAYAGVKKLMYASLESGMENQLQREAECFAANAQTQDFREGVTAFLERRKPDFQGH